MIYLASGGAVSVESSTTADLLESLTRAVVRSWEEEASARQLTVPRMASRASVGSLRRDIATLDGLRGGILELSDDAVEEAYLRVYEEAAPRRFQRFAISRTDPNTLKLVAAVIASQVLGIHFDLVSNLRRGLLRLVDSIRAALRLVLIRVLITLSQHRDAPSIVLVMIATARRFGHRAELGDYFLPVPASMSVEIGGAVRVH